MDGHHADVAGQYLGGCVFYEVLFGASVVGNAFIPPGLDAAEARYLQERIDATGNYYASPVAADGRIFVASLNGRVTVVKAGGAKPEILHQADFKERIAPTMAIVGDNIYLRTQTKLYAFGTKPAEAAK